MTAARGTRSRRERLSAQWSAKAGLHRVASLLFDDGGMPTVVVSRDGNPTRSQEISISWASRALYAAFVELGPAYHVPRFKLRGVGYQLNLALERAGQGGPGTFPHRCSWLIAETALDDLNELIDAHFASQ